MDECQTSDGVLRAVARVLRCEPDRIGAFLDLLYREDMTVVVVKKIKRELHDAELRAGCVIGEIRSKCKHESLDVGESLTTSSRTNTLTTCRACGGTRRPGSPHFYYSA